jgi:hypothetical protein
MKESKEEQEMVKRAEALRGMKQEKMHLLKLRAVHQDTLRQIGKKDIGDPEVRKEASDAQLGTVLVDARLRELELPSSDFDQLDALHRLEGERYNQRVMAARAAAFETLIASQLAFFEGDERACRRYWERVQPPHPFFHKFQQALHHHPSGERERRDVAQEVAGFLAKKGRHSKILGLD